MICKQCMHIRLYRTERVATAIQLTFPQIKITTLYCVMIQKTIKCFLKLIIMMGNCIIHIIIGIYLCIKIKSWAVLLIQLTH